MTPQHADWACESCGKVGARRAPPHSVTLGSPSSSGLDRRIVVTTEVFAAPAGQSASRAIRGARDRKSTRLNSSHGYISYAVFCLKKKNNPKVAYAVHEHERAQVHQE